MSEAFCNLTADQFVFEERGATDIKGIGATPFRYAMMATDLLIFGRFIFDMLTFRREWRK